MWTNTSFTYDGNDHVPTATVDTGVNGEKMTLTTPKAQKDAGTYDVSVSCKSVTGGRGKCSNYSLSNTKTKFTINPARDATVGSCNKDAKADGKTAIVTGGTYVTYSNNTSTSSGSKKVTAKANKNHTFSDGTASKEITCNVKPAQLVTVSGPTTCNIRYCSYSFTCIFKIGTWVIDSYIERGGYGHVVTSGDSECKNDMNNASCRFLYSKTNASYSLTEDWSCAAYDASNKYLGDCSSGSRSGAVSRCKSLIGSGKQGSCSVTCGGVG